LGSSSRADAQPRTVDFEALPYAPRHVVCYRTPAPLTIDGRLDEEAWGAVEWSAPFVDIDGVRPVRHATRVKLLWDDRALYIAATLDEPDLWATLKERDAIIFNDHDFEVFLDPDGDTHAYYELEVNALGTPWDLLLVQPYRDGGPAIHDWNISGLKVGVQVRGTLSRPGDTDEGWTVELALPWASLREAANDHRAPRDGEHWRLNFSRVQWTLDVRDGAYSRRLDAATGKRLPEDNWVWSPQGAIDMHMPERWGVLQFTDAPAGSRTVGFVEDRNDRVRWALRRLYYRQRTHRRTQGRYATDLAALRVSDIRVEGLQFRPTLHVTPSMYEIIAAGFDDTTVHIRQDGKVWTSRTTPRR
ncbi:MAG TPA: carbohydrate-binding family 9-like protein, partial [Luteitalea sp.]|nr:carbohydrate-binding family 9-like protein [Luteitalea sp.]